MTQEDKQLLLADLCGRLPYGVIIRHADYLIDSDGNYTGQFWYKRGYLYNICRLDNMTTTIIESKGSDEEGYKHICDLERSLPYLRPMSSMTEEEKEILKSKCFRTETEEDWEGIRCDSWGIEILNKYDTKRWDNTIHVSSLINMDAIDWLNKNMFDYRGLIEKGLALEAPEGMYKEEQQ